jgi:hypothetical protein
MEPITKSERKRMRVECSMLYRNANQLRDFPDDASKQKARAVLMEAEQIRLMLEMTR